MPAALSFTDSVATDGGGSSYQFNTRAIGSAAADRVVVVAAFGRDAGTSATMTGATIGGNAATAIVGPVRDNPVNNTMAGLFALLVPTGTTSNIVINFSKTIIRCGIGVWALTGTGGDVAAFAAQSNVVNANPMSVLLTTGADGCALAAAFDGSGGSTSSSWSGVTEDWDTVFGTNSYSGGHVNSTSAGSISIDDTFSAAPTEAVLVAASWVPPSGHPAVKRFGGVPFMARNRGVW